MKSFLVLVEDHGWMPPTLRAAQLLGERFGAHLAGVAVDPGRQVIVVGETAYAQAPPCSARLRRQQQAQRLFADYRDTYIAAARPGTNMAVSFGWAETDAIEDDDVGPYSRGFDLVALCKPQPCADGPRWATLRNALLKGGKPVLVCPDTQPDRIGSNVLIYDDGTAEAARAIALAAPVLEKAECVTILSEAACASSDSAMLRSLRRNGVVARLSVREDTRGSAGRAILAMAADLRCDLIVKGGYTRAWLLEHLLGRTTDYTVVNAGVPILMAH